MEKINIAELLKDCPRGMELDCTMYNDVKFIGITEYDKPIRIRTGDTYRYLTKYGTWSFDENAKCVIFPKGKATWEGFVPPCKFKDGDILYVKAAFDWICIYKESEDTENVYKYVAVLRQQNATSIIKDTNCLCYRGNVSEIRLATEEEKEKLFDTIKANGYKWNDETKTLEKLIEPKFKVGDRIKSVLSLIYYTVVDIKNNNYVIKSDTEKYPYQVSFELEINYELVPNKFDINTLKPFDKVLARDTYRQVWIADFFSHIVKEPIGGYRFACIGHYWHQCIPYEMNEHLLGTTDDCDEFYKTW